MTQIPSVLYRWVTDADLRAYSRELSPLGSRPLDKPGVVAWIEGGRFTIGPFGKQMTVRDYLSSSMGVGGNVIGFFEYIEDWSDAKKSANPAYNDMRMTKLFLGRGRHLLIVPMAYYDGPPILGTSASLDETIVPCPGYLKITKLGGLMETKGTYGQEAEWNFIPGQSIALPAIIVRFGTFDSTGSFTTNAAVGDSSIGPLFLQMVNDIVRGQGSKTPPPIRGIVNISECPRPGGRRRTRKRVSRKKRTQRNMLPNVVGSYTWGR